MDALIVFAREPQLGKVKSRLAKQIGETAALTVYRRLLDRTLRTAGRYSRDRRLGAAGSIELIVSTNPVVPGGRLARYCERVGATLIAQQGENLGQRMHAAIRAGLSAGARRVVLIGCDCPELTQQDLRSAFHALKHHQVVLGPTRDGGYCLIGTVADDPTMFRSIPWGTDTVCRITRTRAQQAGYRVYELRLQSDIDRLEDWLAWQKMRERLGRDEFDWHA